LVADLSNNLIRQIVLSTGSVSTLAGVAGSAGAIDGIGSNSKFNYPYGVSSSPDGLFALVADYNNNLIRQIILSTASVSTLAGVAGSAGATNGIGTNSRFNSPIGVSISPDGLFALVAEWSNHLIRHIILSTASVSTLAGVAGSAGATNGMGTTSKFNCPYGVSISPDGLFALVGEWSNFLIRHIILSTASVSTLAGVAGSAGATNGMGTNSQFSYPVGVSISPDGLFALVADRSNHLIRQIILSTASVSTLTGVAGSAGATNGIGTNSKFNRPYGVSISPDGLFALVADRSNNLIRQIILSTTSPSSLPSVSPTITSATIFGFGAKIGGVGMLSSGKAILVDYLQDKRRGLLSFFLLFLLPYLSYLLFQER
jgi:DNA-binding beta-propeller fold protein YncE